MKVSEGPILLQYELPASVSKTWSALVIWEEMIQWFFADIPAFRPEVGFRTSFPVHSEGRTFTHQWKIVAVEQEQSITYEWNYGEYPGNAFLTFSLAPINSQSTRVEIKMDILEDFPDEIPEFQRSSCIGGWNYFMDRLKKYLE